ncbi:MAG: exonuclease SbcCD subunit D [Clostridiales bacterium]|nr:exonuclease SbcCD subunit D [Clostridiales bacterium]
MKLFHISDLHIGKQLHYYNLRDNQIEILDRIVELAKEHRPDVIIIAGDIYDKSVPSAEATTIFDGFLNSLSDITPNIPVLIIAGNHDSAERLKYASTFLEKHQIYISALPPQTKEERLKKVILQDEYGEVDFYLLPFTKPGYVRHLFEEGTVTSYDKAIAALIERENIDYSRRNVLISHQFYVSGDKLPDTCDSEQLYISVGGIDCVDIASVRKFDYVALGHLHGGQYIGEKHIRYSGSPLKYSVSEEKHTKAVTMVTIGAKGEDISVEMLPLNPRQDVRKLSGSLSEIISMATEQNRHNFVSITLTDEEEIYKPKEQLEEYYDHILEVRVENSRTLARLEGGEAQINVLDPFEAFRQFYQDINNEPMSVEEEKIILELIDRAKEAEEL